MPLPAEASTAAGPACGHGSIVLHFLIYGERLEFLSGIHACGLQPLKGGMNLNRTSSKAMPDINLRRFDCTNPGRGPWQVVDDIRNRSVNVRHKKSRFIHRVYYGTRTERTEDDAKIQAIALCAILNALKAKRP